MDGTVFWSLALGGLMCLLGAWYILRGIKRERGGRDRRHPLASLWGLLITVRGLPICGRVTSPIERDVPQVGDVPTLPGLNVRINEEPTALTMRIKDFSYVLRNYPRGFLVAPLRTE